MVSQLRLRDMVLTLVAGTCVSALAVFAFTWCAGAAGFTAETSGQVAIGTTGYGFVRQLADWLTSRGNVREARRRAALELERYAACASNRVATPRNLDALLRDLRELRGAADIVDRRYYDQALAELEAHGTTATFANLDDDVALVHINLLAKHLAA